MKDILYRCSRRCRRISIRVTHDLIVIVTYPPHADMSQVQAFVKSRQDWIYEAVEKLRNRPKPVAPPMPDISQIDWKQFQNEIFNRLEEFSRLHNLPYQRGAFRCQKSLWGSCSHHNHISLNLNLVLLPRHLQDYVLLHELNHIRHKNHSPAFWAGLDKMCGGRAKALAQELKSHSPRLALKKQREA